MNRVAHWIEEDGGTKWEGGRMFKEREKMKIRQRGEMYSTEAQELCERERE